VIRFSLSPSSTGDARNRDLVGGDLIEADLAESSF
jgi:hypothetical protein